MIKRKPRNQYEKKLFAVLSEIDELSHKHGFVVFAVGGFCRDEALNVVHKPNKDVDLMAESYRGLDLAGLVSEHFNEEIEYHHRTGTAKVIIDGISFDFQANIKIFEFLPEMRKTDLPQNAFTFNILSRDFTVNSLAISLRTWKLYDLTGMGVKDLHGKVLRTPINPEVVLEHNPIVALRAIRFAVQYGFSIAPELKKAIADHPEFIKKILPRKKEEVLQESIDINEAKTISLLDELDIPI